VTQPAQQGKVYLVGAGPGTLDMLTLRAHALISLATCLLHDDLVSDEVLSLAASSAIVQNVGKRCGEKTITQEEINDWMVHYAEEGHSVVRLKSGDPLLFGRAAEEIAALTAANVSFEVVPGVSTGFAAASIAGIPLTGRISSSRLLFATRHLAAGNTSGLAGIGADVTLVLYMPGRDYAAIAAELSANGWSADTRCVIASSMGTPRQQIISCLLLALPTQQRLPSPTLMLFIPAEREA